MSIPCSSLGVQLLGIVLDFPQPQLQHHSDRLVHFVN